MSSRKTGTESLLLVEDDAAVRKLYQEILSRAGYDVKTAASAKEADMVAQEFSPTIALLDLTLPDKQGIDIVKNFQQNHPNTSVIVLSGMDDAQLREETISLGVTAFLTKPIRREELLHCLQNTVNLKKCG